MNELYCYLDSRKPGKFIYPNLDVCFLFEPFYVGISKTKTRKFSHLKEALDESNDSEKSKQIREIIEEDRTPFIIILKKDSSIKISNYEKVFVKNIGRSFLNQGPLTNICKGGFGGYGGEKQRNRHAKKWIIITPKGERIDCHGNFSKYCEKFNFKSGFRKALNQIERLQYKGFQIFSYKDDSELQLIEPKIIPVNKLKEAIKSDKNKNLQSWSKSASKGGKGRKGSKTKPENHPMSKKYFWTSPNGKTFESHGINQICEKFNLSKNTIRAFIDKGKINFDSYALNVKNRCLGKDKTKNCINWSISIL